MHLALPSEGPSLDRTACHRRTRPLRRPLRTHRERAVVVAAGAIQRTQRMRDWNEPRQSGECLALCDPSVERPRDFRSAMEVQNGSKTHGHNTEAVMPVSACYAIAAARGQRTGVGVASAPSECVHTSEKTKSGQKSSAVRPPSLIIRPHPSCPTCGGACRPQTRIATLMSHHPIAVNHQGSGARRSESTHISGRHAMTSPVFASATKRRSTSGTRRGTTATRSPRLAIRRGITLTKSHLLEA